MKHHIVMDDFDVNIGIDNTGCEVIGQKSVCWWPMFQTEPQALIGCLLRTRGERG